jgi:hypothetical protein
MNEAVAGRKPRVTQPKDEIRLHAKTAIVHGEKLRYEEPPQKNTLGFWTRAEDWASWKFDVPAAGKYEIEVQQGCGKGSGGAAVGVEVGGKSFEFTVIETGHFQHFILRTIGIVDLAAGPNEIALKPKNQAGCRRHGCSQRRAPADRVITPGNIASLHPCWSAVRCASSMNPATRSSLILLAFVVFGLAWEPFG